MAKQWFIDTSASKQDVLAAANHIFFTRPSFAERLKFWSKSAQLRSNLVWERASVSGADVAASVKSGGLREAAGTSKYGGGSMLGTTIGVVVEDTGTARQVTFVLTAYNTMFGINQQSDLVKWYAKQVAAQLVAGGAAATASRR